MITTKQYNEAMKVLKEGRAQRDIITDTAKQKQHENGTKYQDLIRELEKQKYAIEQEIQTKEDADLKALETQMEGSLKIQKEFKTMMELFKVIENGTENNFKVPEVYFYNYDNKVSCRPLYYIFADPYKSIGVYIVPNKKPKNKLSLILVGNTIFHEEVLRSVSNTLAYELHNYGLSVNTNGANVVMVIKDASTEKALNDYSNSKQFNNLVTNFSNQLKTLEEMYEQAKKLYQEKEWQIEYMKHLKHYYEEQYCNGINKPEYKEVIKKLNALLKD